MPQTRGDPVRLPGLGPRRRLRGALREPGRPGLGKPDAGLHGPAGPARGPGGRLGLPPADGHARRRTTGCTSPTCARAAGSPRPWTARPRPGWWPRSRGALRDEPADLIISVFAAGVPAAAGLAASRPGLRTIVLCADALPHATWVREGIDLFLVTSRPRPPPACAATCPGPGSRWSRRRYGPRSATCCRGRRPARRWGYRRMRGASCSWAADGGWARWRGPHARWPPPGCTCWPWPGRNRRLDARLRALAAVAPGPPLRLHPADRRADERLRPRRHPAGRADLRRGAGGRARAGARRRDARPRPGERAARAGAGRGRGVRPAAAGDRGQRAGRAGPAPARCGPAGLAETGIRRSPPRWPASAQASRAARMPWQAGPPGRTFLDQRSAREAGYP